MLELVTIIVTGLGIGLIAWGTYCAFTAYASTWRENASQPLYPTTSRALALVRAWLIRTKNKIFRRQPAAVLGELHGAAPAAVAALNVRAIKSGGRIPSEIPVSEQIALIVTRLNNIEDAARGDRASLDELHKQFRGDMNTLSRRIDHGDHRIEQIARTNATGTLKMQVKALILVGLGSILTAIPSIVVSVATLVST